MQFSLIIVCLSAAIKVRLGRHEPLSSLVVVLDLKQTPHYLPQQTWITVAIYQQRLQIEMLQFSVCLPQLKRNRRDGWRLISREGPVLLKISLNYNQIVVSRRSCHRYQRVLKVEEKRNEQRTDKNY